MGNTLSQFGGKESDGERTATRGVFHWSRRRRRSENREIRASRVSRSRARDREKRALRRTFRLILRVQGPQPLPPTAQVILPSSRRQRSAALTLGAGLSPAGADWLAPASARSDS